MKFLPPTEPLEGEFARKGWRGVGKTHIGSCNLWGAPLQSVGKGQPTKFMGVSFGFSSSSSQVFWLGGFMGCRLFILFLLR